MLTASWLSRHIECVPDTCTGMEHHVQLFNVRLQRIRNEPNLIILEPVRLIHGANMGSEALLYLLIAPVVTWPPGCGMPCSSESLRKKTPTSTQLPCSEEDPRSVSRTSRNIYQECEPQQCRHMSRNTWVHSVSEEESAGLFETIERIEPRTSRTLSENHTTRPSSQLSMKFGWIVTLLNGNVWRQP